MENGTVRLLEYDSNIGQYYLLLARNKSERTDGFTSQSSSQLVDWTMSLNKFSALTFRGICGQPTGQGSS